MAKLELNFKGFDAYLEELQKLGANIVDETEKALQESGEIVSKALHEEMKPHHVTGETEAAIYEPKVTWNGTKASVKFGFDYKHGGEPALYLEKGRPHRQAITPVIAPAMEKSEKEINKKFEDALTNAIKRANG